MSLTKGSLLPGFQSFSSICSLSKVISLKQSLCQRRLFWGGKFCSPSMTMSTWFSEPHAFNKYCYVLSRWVSKTVIATVLNSMLPFYSYNVFYSDKEIMNNKKRTECHSSSIIQDLSHNPPQSSTNSALRGIQDEKTGWGILCFG